MLELGIAQAQARFTKILTQTVVILDKKAHQKKAVILPYDEYIRLLARCKEKPNLDNGVFNEFVGILDNDFESEDTKYKELMK